LLGRRAPEHSLAGIILAAASLMMMPVLSVAKFRVAHELGSRAMNADARQTEFCSYLSAILLAGLLLNAVVGWWWADPVAALIMAPSLLEKGITAFEARSIATAAADFPQRPGSDINPWAYLDFLWKSHQHLIGFSHLDMLQMS
jgi:hypothetical protein